MKYYIIEPEVAGGLGERTIMDRSVHPPKVARLHFNFEGWLGDVLLESFPCFIATDRVMQELRSIHSSGVSFDDVEITKTKQFEELYPDRRLPKFWWLKVRGTPGVDDFGLMNDSRLVISQRVLNILESDGLKNANIEPFGV